MKAFELQKKVYISSMHTVPCLYVGDLMPIDLPPLAVRYARAIPSATLDMLKSIGYQDLRYRGKDLLLFEKYTWDQFVAIRNTKPVEYCDIPDRAINLGAVGPFRLVLRLLSCLLRTHHYPAFRTPTHVMTSPQLSGKEVVKRKRTAAGPSSERVAEKRPRVNLPGVPEEGSEPEAMEEDEDEEYEQVETEVIGAAFPPPPDTRGWGSIKDIPAQFDGVFCAFLPDLVMSDKHTVPMIIEKFLLPALGSSPDGIKKNLQSIRQAWGNVGPTDAGAVLAHLAKCLYIALNAQASCFPIFSDNVYEGTVILGAGITWVVEDQVTLPVTHELICSRILAFNGHRKSIEGIAALAGLETIGNNLVIAEKEVEISSMMQLKMVLSAMAITEEHRDQIKKLAAGLRLERSWGFHADAITRGFSLLASDDALPDDLPIHPSTLFETDRVALVWSCFGAMAPTPKFQSAPSYDLRKVNRPLHIMFEQCVLNRAIADIKDMIRNKTITVPAQTRRSGNYKVMTFRGHDARTIFSGITQACRVVPATDGIEQGGRGDLDPVGEDVDIMFL